MAEQDGRGPIQKESKSVLHLSPRQGSHHRTVPGIKGPPRAANQGRTLKGFRARLGGYNYISIWSLTFQLYQFGS